MAGNNSGIFVISIDFELFWGVRDVFSIDEYYDNLNGTRSAVTAILKLFEKYSIHATWAAVGLLFFSSIKEMRENFPAILPGYADKNLCPFCNVEDIPSGYNYERFFCAKDVLDEIRSYKNQEIASHTFSHFFCCEPGQTKESFLSDLESFKKVAENSGIDVKSIVFPKNQVNDEYLSLLNEFGIKAYRGNEKNRFNPSVEFGQLGFLRRFGRFIDSIVVLTDSKCYELSSMNRNGLVDVSASSFFRPHSNRVIDWLQIKRIKGSLQHAARNGQVFHLWFHPHNFGKNLTQNIQKLEAVVLEFCRLKNEYGLCSANMGEVAKLVLEKV